MAKQRLTNTPQGYLRGISPSAQVLTVWHQTADRTGFRLWYSGHWHYRFAPESLKSIFGISPRIKRTGFQVGYPSEPVIQAAWRYLKDLYNRGDGDVIYTITEPEIDEAEHGVPSETAVAERLLQEAATFHITRAHGGGESLEHESLKKRIAERPTLVGVYDAERAHVEHQYPTGDRADIAFKTEAGWAVVEVELQGGPETTIGLFQAIKYRALQEALLHSLGHKGCVRAILAAHMVPRNVRDLAGRLGVEVAEVK